MYRNCCSVDLCAVRNALGHICLNICTHRVLSRLPEGFLPTLVICSLPFKNSHKAASCDRANAATCLKRLALKPTCLALRRIYPQGYPGAKMAASHEQHTHMAALKANMAKIPGCATSLLQETWNGQILVATSQRVALEPKRLTTTKLQAGHLFQISTSQMARCLWIKNYLVMTACLNDFTPWAT